MATFSDSAILVLPYIHPFVYTGIVAITAWFFLSSRIGPSVDATEPPLLKASFPLVGHILGAGKHQTSYLRKLNKGKNLKAASLPILTGKLYVIFDPSTAQSAFRNTQLSLLPIAREAALKQLHLSEQAREAFRSTNLQDDLNNAIRQSSSGAAVSLLSKHALEYIGSKLNRKTQVLQNEVENSDLYMWVRNIMTSATVLGLFGLDSVLEHNQNSLDDLWTFEGGLSKLTTSWFPRYYAKDAFYAKIRLEKALETWYEAGKDHGSSVSQVVKSRAAILRSHNFTNAEMAEMEIGLLHVSTSNTIPVAFWFLAHVLSSPPKLIQQVRQQLELAVDKRVGPKAFLNVALFEEKYPLLLRCYHEALRISIHAGHFRRVLDDTIVSDGQGTSYTLKKGFDLLLSSDCSHSIESIWGSHPSRFDPSRFSASSSASPSSPSSPAPLSKIAQEVEKSRKTAFHPFGGGKHLCPGRNYANAEILGFVGSLILLFDFFPAAKVAAAATTTTDQRWNLPEMENAKFFEAAAKPVKHGEGFKVKIQRRQDWKDVHLVLRKEVV